MAISYKWTINALDTHISHEGKSDVINQVHWSYQAIDEDYSMHMIGAYSPKFDKDDFIEYGSLKETDVTSWLEKNLDVDKMKENLKNQIEVLKTPVAKTYSQPFAKKEE